MRAPALATFDLAKDYGTTRALAGLDLQVNEGEVVGCLGPNGAGKTTLIRLVLGLLIPTRGRAEVFGLDAQRDTVASHRRLAYVPGEANLWPSLSGAETLRLLGQAHGHVDVDYRSELIDRFSLDVTKRVRALSKGNRQKLILIAALMTRADLLILDEPTSGLDPLMEQEFRRCVQEAKEHGQSVLLSSHILSEVEALCDRIAILRAGNLVEIGTMAEMRHLSALTVEVTFDGDVPDVAHVEGVSSIEVSGSTLRCLVRGPMEPLLVAITNRGVRELLSREPSLEELFLSHYGSSADEVTGESDTK
ncbi:MAG: ATP-binding cassette domain-containing protein [Acidimicrobiales bacterium]